MIEDIQAAIPLGFIFADPELNGIAGAILLATFIGTGSSFLAFAIAAEKFKIDKPQFKYKSFYYLNGLTEGTETIALFVAFCLWPQSFSWLALLFSFACMITIFTRIHGGYNTLKEQEASLQESELSLESSSHINTVEGTEAKND